MRPQPACCMVGRTAWVQAKTPSRLTASSRRHCSGMTSVKNTPGWSMPALLTRMSKGPVSATAARGTGTRCRSSAGELGSAFLDDGGEALPGVGRPRQLGHGAGLVGEAGLHRGAEAVPQQPFGGGQGPGGAAGQLAGQGPGLV